MPGKHQDSHALNFSSITELNNFVDKVKINVNTQVNCKQYCKSANDIFRKAEVHYNSKDEENAYILYMRCFNIYKAVRKSYEFSKAKNVMQPLLVNVNPLKCVSRAEELIKSLTIQYEKKQADLIKQKELAKIKVTQNGQPKNDLINDLDDLILPDVPTGFHETNSSVSSNKTNGKPSQNKSSNEDQDHSVITSRNNKQPLKDLISVSDFYQLLKANKEKLDCIFIFDVRKLDEYNGCRIQHDYTMNISPTSLPSNANQNSVERRLSKENWEIWTQRFNKSYLIIVSEDFDESSASVDVLLSHPAVVLQEILCNCCEADYAVYILNGGLQKWVMEYPAETTNPNYKRSKIIQTEVDVDSFLEGLGSYPTLTKKTIEEPENLIKPEEEVSKGKTLNESSENDKEIDNRNLVNDISEGTLYPSLEKAEKKSPLINNFVEPKKTNSKEIASEKILDEKTDEKIQPIQPSLNEQLKTLKTDPANVNVAKTLPGPQSQNIQPNSTSVGVNDKKQMPNQSEIKNSVSVNDKKQPSFDGRTKQLKTTPGLPYGWQKHIDQRTGKEYFIDHHTQKTHWALPPEVLNSSKPMHATNLNSKVSPAQTKSTIQNHLPTVESKGPESQVPPSEKKVLPNGNIKQPGSMSSQLQEPKLVPSNKPLDESSQKPKPTSNPQQPTLNAQLPAVPKPQQPTMPPSNAPPAQTLQPSIGSQMPNQARSIDTRNSQQQTLIQPKLPQTTQQHVKPTNEPKVPQVNDKPPQPKPIIRTSPPSSQHQPQTTQQPVKPTNDPRVPQLNDKASQPKPVIRPPQPSSQQQPQIPTPQQPRQIPSNVAPPSQTTKKTPPATTSHTLDTPKQPSLKRSLSSPNLAEGLENLRANRAKTPIVDRMSKPSIPTKDTKPVHLIDRSSKPIAANRLRSLSPVYGSQGLSLTGLKNLGNTCYMNAVLQCLVNTPPLSRFFVSGIYEKDLNAGKTNVNPRPGYIAREFSFIMKVLSSGSYRSVSPIDFKLALGSMSKRFLTYEQQDSHEVLLIVLDGLHNDINKCKIATVTPIRDNSKMTDQEAAVQEWEDYHINNDSLLFNLFYGQFRSTVSCLTCRHQSKTFNTFNCLHLQLPVSKFVTLAQCLELFVRPEKIDSWHCEKCKCDRSASKKIELWKLPPVLIVQFKRFRCEGIWTNKVQTPVDYPITNWDLSNYVTGQNSRFSKYNLYGIINHSGSFESGHYTARCKNAYVGGGWYLYNDERVSDLGSVKTKEAYVLFYTAVNFEEYIRR